uniref:Tail protein n=1 Tax=viral metagenome TaxID=1070528 RepID=A0A6M3K6A5_9ZZZZ
MFEIKINYHLEELHDLVRQYPMVVIEEGEKVMDIIVRRLESEVVMRTPRGVGGVAGLAGSIHGAVVSQGFPIHGVVGTPLEYAIVVEEGRRPNRAMPPVGPIALWAQRKLGVNVEDARSVGFVIARSIGKKGFKGAHMFRKAWEQLERWAQTELQSIVDRVSERLSD